MADHSSDLVQCADTGNFIERGDATLLSDGSYFEDADNAVSCVDCGELFDDLDINSVSNMCDRCHNHNYTECSGCHSDFENNHILSADSGDSFCSDCYSQFFRYCESCDTEVDLENDEYSDDDYSFHCSACTRQNEWEQDFDWTGGAAYDKMGSPRKFGIELESSRCDGYSDWARGYSWGAKVDGSISGKEFVSPPMWGNDGYNNVVEFCENASRNGVRTDDSCGFHLHIDLSDTTAEQRKVIALAYHYTRRVWASMIEPTRRDTFYARYSSGGQFRTVWERDDILASDDYPRTNERYVWVNWLSFSNHRTVEVRSHEATFDGRAVIAWARAHTMFVDYVKGMTVGQVTRTFGCEDSFTIMRELKFVWGAELHDYYSRKTVTVS